jgi:hypothetical protein
MKVLKRRSLVRTALTIDRLSERVTLLRGEHDGNESKDWPLVANSFPVARQFARPGR